MFNALISKHTTKLLGYFNYDLTPVRNPETVFRLLDCDPSECLEPPHFFDTYRKIFERKIRYWDCRVMDIQQQCIVSPADSRVVIGSLGSDSSFHLKGKLFELPELLGRSSSQWNSIFEKGSFAVFRLTPDKYHYNHMPVSGHLLDLYPVSGNYHSCNPSAVMEISNSYSKNMRMVSIIDTDVPGGSKVGIVAMIEVVALMIGSIVQAYSEFEYENPIQPEQGMLLKKGSPKSLFRPGSSTVLLLFQEQRIKFADDLIHNCSRTDVSSRFSHGLRKALVETDIKVRSTIGYAL